MLQKPSHNTITVVLKQVPLAALAGEWIQAQQVKRPLRWPLPTVQTRKDSRSGWARAVERRQVEDSLRCILEMKSAKAGGGFECVKKRKLVNNNNKVATRF